MTPPPGLVSVPHVDWMYSRAALSLLNVSHQLPPGSRFQFKGGGSTICNKRNRAARDVVESDLEWLLFLDSDMVFPPNVVAKLLEHDADVVGGLYCLTQPDYTAVAGHERGERSEDPLRPTDCPEWKVRTLDLRKVGEQMGAVEVDVAGTGCMLIRRRVLEALEAPWFLANESDVATQDQSEDYNFCLRARDAGFTVLCDTRIQAEHLGAHGVTVPKAKGYWRDKVEREQEQTVDLNL